MVESNVWRQRDMTAGQIDVGALRGDDTAIMRAGLRTARNVRILNTRGLRRRPGRRRLFQTTGLVEVIRPAVGETWTMALEEGRVVFRSEDLTQTVTFAGMPWTATDLPKLRFDTSGGNVIIGHQGTRPRVFTYRVGVGWSAGTFSFSVGGTGAVRQPFHNFHAGSGITMIPSGRTGSINVTFSAAVLEPNHAGVSFLYGGRQLRLDTIVDTSHATATCLETLPPTVLVAVDQAAGLETGDVVEGVTSGCKGVVTGGITPTGTPYFYFQVLISKNYNGFQVGEKIAGPRSSMTIQGFTFEVPVATVQWEEALMSDVRGWPGSISSDSQRIIFANFRQYGNGICWSAVGTLNDFLVGADADDAIFDYVPENCQVLSVVGGADEFAFTDTGVFYIPISASNPLRPGSIEFRNISKDASGPVKPQTTTQGICYVNAGASRILAVISTGQTAAPYLVDDLTQYHAPLIKGPVSLGFTASDAEVPERYLYAINGADGSAAVARFDKRQNWTGWVEWDGAGQLLWVSSSGSQIVVTAAYGDVRYAETFDDDLLLDASTPIAAGAFPAGTVVSVEAGGWYRGDYAINADGTFSDPLAPTGVAGLKGGFNFVVEAEPFVPQSNEGPSRKQALRKRRLKQIAAVFQSTQAVEVAGRLVPYWNAGENEEVAPPLRDQTYRARPLGRSWDPRWSVRQTLPGRLTIIEMTTDATV